MKWVVAPRVRCDMVGYSGTDLSGARYIVQIFPTGSRKGSLRTDELKSLAIAGHHGTRVILCTSDDDERWEEHPWRCVRLIEGTTFPANNDLPCVRIPDLDWMDTFDRKRADTEFQTSVPLVNTVAEGLSKGWTFGRGGGSLKNAVRMIRVDREG